MEENTMEQQQWAWKQKIYFNYNIYELENKVDEELWCWHQYMYHEFECMYEACHPFCYMEFEGRILTVFYIEHQGRVFLPGPGVKYPDLLLVTKETLPLAISINYVYELHGWWKDFFLYMINEEEPQPDLTFSKQFDFRKRIGTDIWKPKEKVDRPYYDLWDKPVYVPLNPTA